MHGLPHARSGNGTALSWMLIGYVAAFAVAVRIKPALSRSERNTECMMAQLGQGLVRYRPRWAIVSITAAVARIRMSFSPGAISTP